LEHLALGFAHYDSHADAARTFETASQHVNDAKGRLTLLGRAALEFVRADLNSAALQIVKTMRISSGTVPGGELSLLRVLNEMVEITKEDDISVAVKERIIELDPDDHSTRFSLAYKYSEMGNNDLSLFHYLKIPDAERLGGTWNNLGVQFQRAGLHEHSVIAYREAEGQDETLAMSNLAQKFMAVGFTSEARQLCESALSKKSYHENVPRTLAEIESISGQESEKEEEITKRAKHKSDFYRGFGRATSQSEPIDGVAKNWTGPNCDLVIAISGPDVSIVGTYRRTNPPGALSTAMGLPATGHVSHHKIEYSGKMLGRAIEGYVTHTQETPPEVRSLLSENEKTRVLMFLNDDGTEISVIENPHGNAPAFYGLRRK
jgi:tetratricopeptide (TPR) repeat protein